MGGRLSRGRRCLVDASCISKTGFCLESGIAFDGFTLLTYPLMPLILPSTSFFLLFFPGPLSVEYYCIFLVVALQLFSSLVVLIRKRWIPITSFCVPRRCVACAMM